MSNNQQKGKRGEDIAASYLEANGFNILERRYNARRGEADIIAMNNGTLVFAEVKARSGVGFGLPAEAIDIQKQKRITIAAQAFIQKNAMEDYPVRFDVVEVYLNSGEINHITSAFDAIY